MTTREVCDLQNLINKYGQAEQKVGEALVTNTIYDEFEFELLQSERNNLQSEVFATLLAQTK